MDIIIVAESDGDIFMRVSTNELRDCELMKGIVGRTSTIEIECGYECEKCGWNAAIAEVRKKRIESRDWSWDSERHVCYLSLRDGR